MNIFENNIYILDYYRNALLECIYQEEYTELENEMSYTYDVAKNGEKYMMVSTAERCIRLNSAYNPSREAASWVKNCLEQKDFYNIYVVYGFGNGYHIRELVKNIKGKDKIFVYEPYISLFMNVLKEYDITDLIKNEDIYLYVGQKAFLELRELLDEKISLANFNINKIIALPGYNEISEKDWNVFNYNVWSYYYNQYGALSTMADFGDEFIDNQLYITSNIQGVCIFDEVKKAMPEGITLIVVAAGPSLSKNVDDLKMFKNKAFILATDTAIKTLMAKDIIPDAIVCLDPHKPMDNFADDRCKDLPMFCCFDTRKEVVEGHRGKKILVKGPSVLTNILSTIHIQIGEIITGGSVATAALGVGLAINASNIIFVGQDLAYGKDYSTHAGKVSDEGKDSTREKVVIDGIDGVQVVTRSDWLLYLMQIEDLIPRYKNTRFIDATEGGALIHGAEIMKLKECLSVCENDDYDFEKILNGIQPSFEEDDVVILKKALQEIEDNLVEIKENHKEIQDEGRDIISLINAGRDYDTLTKEVEHFNECLNGLSGHKSNVLVLFCSMKHNRDLFINMNKDCGSEKETILNHYRCLIEISENAIKVIPELIEKIKQYE